MDETISSQCPGLPCNFTPSEKAKINRAGRLDFDEFVRVAFDVLNRPGRHEDNLKMMEALKA